MRKVRGRAGGEGKKVRGGSRGGGRGGGGGGRREKEEVGVGWSEEEMRRRGVDT